MASKEGKTQSFARRDHLLQLQQAAQQDWQASKVFEVDAPDTPDPDNKFFGNFPYPYMNGLLHLGHAFSLSKLEFAAAYHRLCGKKVLFPQGFHCTGMPIKACADKLTYEIATYGCPPVVPDSEAPVPEEDEAAKAAEQAAKDPTKFSGKKSKAAAKSGTAATQWGIMKQSGLTDEEIPAFRDPLHWLEHFPPLAKRDMTAMGCGIDWRRSFITTDVNPYYDSFVRWQFNTLKKQGRVVKDKRYAVYSPKDGQPCADHDRASGEGVGPQDYTLIKLKVLELHGKLEQLKGQGDLFLLAATLRPETMYGQTNAWVLPDGEYGVFKGLNNELYVMTERSARNLSYQERMPVAGQPECVLALTGHDLIGTPVRAPNAILERIYVLPMLTILTNKGTGVVTSVPSDSPDDYMCLLDLKKKDKLREKYGVQDDWVLPFEVIPIIHIPEFGNQSAQFACEQLKVQSQNDAVKLAEAKNMVYLKGFTDGIMEVGPYAGRKVSEVKPIIRDELIAEGLAMPYSEPEKQVISRSGDECVVALTDQWYLIYGEEEWAAITTRALEAMRTYSTDVQHAFEHTLGWLKQWACSRSFGLGTRLPWDPDFLIESLSDSTIYMAYYTVAHLLQGGDMYGRAAAPAVPAEDVTDGVWDHVLLGAPVPPDCKVAPALLQRMRTEFDFWYPFDLRVSGKDLIQNHLTFCLYNHTAILPEKQWPRGMRCNGHLQLNGEKMSKSTGNFKTLEQAVQEYSADAMRAALADAGDALEDANFEEQTANGAILRLTKELAWIEETLAATGMREEPPSTFLDRVFDNAINHAVHAAKQAYDALLFREALKAAWYDLQGARDTYRFAVGEEGMNRQVLMRYMEVSTQLMAPICPHTMEHTWRRLLNKPGSVLTAGWPHAPTPDAVLAQSASYVDSFIAGVRAQRIKSENPKPRKGQPVVKHKVTHTIVFVAASFIGWHAETLAFLRSKFDPASRKFADDTMKLLPAHLKASEACSAMSDKDIKSVVFPFARPTMDKAQAFGDMVLQDRLPFDETALLRDNLAYIQRSLELDSMELRSVHEPGEVPAHGTNKVAAAIPGSPAVVMLTEPIAS